MPGSSDATLGDVALIGAGCLLPGAGSPAELWQLLLAERNAVSQRPHGRWNVERFLRPGEPAPGYSYTFAGGYIDGAFAFDPAPFGISPREAQQMDPQQRLLLCATWRALEDAGLPPSSLAGRDVGVYVGASAADYQGVGAFDPAVIGSHFMTGNALSILSNRISYAFDLRGPSFTVDSACSSSFVALAQGMAALRSGQVEMAIVAGVNMLLSPMPFIGFSQARMLSPTGLCRPFSSEADGYVRSEGAVVLVLQRLSDACVPGRRVRSVIVAAATNSDGRTNGISLPSQRSQQQVIENLYADAQVDPRRLAFVEAHGTGTKIGDPIEAAAIGESLGRRRCATLPVGSVKSNIGHLEAASGLAGLLKASLALEHGLVPRSLFAESRNDAIDFAGLNLAPVTRALPITAQEGAVFAGVCNYGFGGTNGHAILRSAFAAKIISARPQAKRDAEVLLVSASTQDALKARAQQIAEALSKAEAARIAGALAHQREVLPHRLAVPLATSAEASREAAATLRAFGAGSLQQGRASGATAHGAARRGIFVFSGNGGQYPQMGQLAYGSSAAFRREIDAIDAVYRPLAGWSLAERIRDGVSVEQLERTSVAQPLIFAVQSALSAILTGYGVSPVGVIGHSVGEIAAAECAGLITRVDALRILHVRSEHQEAVRGMGRMLVLAADPASVQALIDETGASDVDLAAYNSATSITVSGPADQIAAIADRARKRRVASVPLGIDYPFHSRALDGVEDRIVANLSGVASQAAQVPFYSTVTGRLHKGKGLDARYWWNNIRHPVRFLAAIDAALAAHPDAAFIELAPRAILLGAIAETARARDAQPVMLPTLAANDRAGTDPVRAIAARLVANGVEHDVAAIFGAPPRELVPLPPYPFQPEDYHFEATSEALNAHGRLIASAPLHPLLGVRVLDGAPEWRNLLDPVLVPYLSDHRVDGGVVLPAAALIEMALAAGAELTGAAVLELGEFDILRAMAFAEDETREVSTRYSDHSGSIEIWSRRRFAGDDWLLHARGFLRGLPASALALQPEIPRVAEPILSEAPEIYGAAERAGLDYGPLFRLVTSTRRDETVGESRMLVAKGGTGAFEDRHVLHPISLDASFHGLFLARPQRDGERKAYLPIRFRQIRVWRQGARISHSVTKLLRESDRFKTLSVSLLGEDGGLVASIEAAVFRSVHLIKPFVADRTFRQDNVGVDPLALPMLEPGAEAASPEAVRQIGLLFKAFAISLARTLCRELLPDDDATFEGLAAQGKIMPDAEPLIGLAREVLAMTGGVESRAGGTGLVRSFSVPSPEAILGTLLQRFPRANREIGLAAQALHGAKASLTGGRMSGSVPDQGNLCTLSAPLGQVVAACLAAWTASSSRRLRLLVVGDWSSGLADAFAPAVQAGLISVTLAVENAARLEEQRHRPGVGSLFDLLVLDGVAQNASAGFEALIGFTLPLSPLRAANEAALGRALALLAEGAPILLAEPSEDVHLAFLFEAASPGIRADGDHLFHRDPDAPRKRLEAAGASEISTWQNGDGGLVLTGARASGRSVAGVATVGLAILAEAGSGALGERFGVTAAKTIDRDGVEPWLAALPAGARATIIVAPAAEGTLRAGLAARIEALAALLKLLGAAGRPCRVFVLTETARANGAGEAGEEAGLWAFGRVAINEFPEIDLRLADLACASADMRLGELLALDNGEREWRITAAGPEVVRVRRGMVEDTPLAPEERSVLHFADGVGLDGFEWHKQQRRAPGEGEIEVEVAAAGLNYRDVMVGLGLLDDDLLGAGLTRAALGFECSGRVVRVGPGVTQHRPGDAVMGFVSGAFASHVVSPDWHFFPIPDNLDLEAAATIPVAFATAWYALVERGHVRAGDDVLVHGAAGGVGLAAIQIAKSRGARVLGTASNPARRAIARAAGADAAFDSRQERFADEIGERFDGVDVVLNSLAGPAMLASFKLLKPFGRFLELGKRDFLDNTQLALRPFLRNIAYSGIDLDELLAADPALVRRMMAELAAAFGRGELRPLTYRSYEGYEVGAAFRTMQASEHIGKIVIRPPRAARIDVAPLSYAARPGLYLVVGGTTGLGFATAHWLSRKGASHIALLSRRGQVDEALAPLLAEMRAAGTQVLIETFDVGDAEAVRAAVSRLSEAHGPVRGVVHAAVHLDDGLIANLSPERLQAVLRTKAEGLVNLDAATRGEPLDFFVAYSSATTLIGSPGQGAYVAANGFLEGFMRARRSQGRPALAIGWGAISDVGIIARDKQLGQRLRRTTGVVPMRSFEALAHLGRLLSLGDAADPVQFLTSIAPGGGGEKLALLKSPAFCDLGLLRGETRRGQAEELTADLRGKSREEAVAIVTDILRREVAGILRMPESKVDLARPLAELGLDSLMALELHMALEAAIGVQVAVVGAGDRNLAEMAGAIVGQLNQAAETTADRVESEMQSTVVKLVGIHSNMDLSHEETGRIERMIQTSSGSSA
ncbi:hypothetical protein ASE63_16220 [Bosea sp. Root381]|uniref:type I polyketide synthase n=1 Tax=Bosea sp. Root381 TaxID=1736524 RepID=UPI0006FE1803|nr:type I polyketide synthase [Bosea sp. Root381]KRE15780.1 hypothetical protein ASE63_16220 [Bosea sp. Root381]